MRSIASAASSAASIAFFWRFRTDECNGPGPTDPNDFPRNDGALLLKTRDNSDMSLLGMIEPPQGDFWLGWDSGGWTLQSDATRIHHPGGTFQRISLGDVTVARRRRQPPCPPSAPRPATRVRRRCD